MKCQVLLDAPAGAVEAGGGTVGVGVRTQPECAWTASSDAPWVMSLAPVSGQGPGEIRVQVSANPVASTRRAEIIVNGNRAPVQQAAAACRFEVSPAASVVGAAQGAETLAVETIAGCSWNAVSQADWIRIESGASGVGAGAVALSVAANDGLERTGTVTVAATTVTVTQAAIAAAPPQPGQSCAYNITPSVAVLAVSGGTQRIAVAAPPECGWSATSSASWITIVAGRTGQGAGTVELSVAPNASDARSATLVVAGQSLTVVQRRRRGLLYRHQLQLQKFI